MSDDITNDGWLWMAEGSFFEEKQIVLQKAQEIKKNLKCKLYQMN